ncbi:MAG: hypothetical protein IJ506_05020 [Clostridia bacterium]|nr:hypothetical protein [Clostridia bacterium]
MLKKYYLKCDSVNTLPARAYYVPFKKGQNRDKREKSERFQSLNGAWKIRAYESVLGADNFWTGEGVDEILVPSCVQYFGYDYFQYVDFAYPFPYNPPHIPEKIPCYHYSKRFTCQQKSEKTYLVFEGVDSAFYVYINGKFVGYSCISHRISEFDVGEHLVEGENKIDVLVLKWNAGSYLEDQDKWRFTGIFRDVYLLFRPTKHIVDYRIQTKIDRTEGLVYFFNESKVDISVSLDGQTKTVEPGQTTMFLLEDVCLWSAEDPCLYEMQISANDEIIFERVGVCTSEVEGGLYLFNGKPIKFYGVNRNDFHPEKGATLSYEDMLADVLLMKKLNINAVRTSHYPASPLFYELCDEYGLYVMSESDLEHHGGVWAGNWKEYTDHQRMSWLANDPFFANSYIERQVNNIQPNKNRPCVVMWSLGNESGVGANTRLALQKMRELDKSRPLHYEGINALSMEKLDPCIQWAKELEIISRMYVSVNWIKSNYFPEKENRPLLLCEYSHAIGNGPGGIQEYWDLFRTDEHYMGGFIWEFADQAVRYKEKGLRYGGDFGETVNNGNYCVDGILTADRKIKSGTLHMKYIYQPLEFRKEGERLWVKNRNFFAVEKGDLYVVGRKKQRIPVQIQPREEIELIVEKGTISVDYKKESEIAATWQAYENTPSISEWKEANEVQIQEEDERIYVQAGDVRYILDKAEGEIICVMKGDVEYGAIRWNVFRAPLDNDDGILPDWNKYYLRYARPFVEDIRIENGTIRFTVYLGYACFKPLIRATVAYSFGKNGVKISVDYQDEEEFFLFLPRVGFTLTLDKAYNKVKYFAYGPQETYSDMYLFSKKGEYENTVDKEYYHYVKPQESGSHFSPDWAEVSDGRNAVRIEGMQSFSALPYSWSVLANTKHDYELPEPDATYLSADFYMTGVGTGHCGSLPSENCRVPHSGKGEICFIFKNEEV